MAITITWSTKVINVPQADLTNLGGGVYELNIDTFRNRLNELQASEEGITELTTHIHNPPTVIAGVSLARVVEIINGYTVTFEDGSYAVNLVGANSNIADVTNVNSVSIRSSNSAGLTYSRQVEDQSFIGSRVWIDTDVGISATPFPAGTPGQPVNNLENAQSIISNRRFPNRVHLRGDLTVSQPIPHYDVRGAGRNLSSMSFNGYSTSNSFIKEVTATGVVSGAIQFELCKIYNLFDFVGSVSESEISGTIRLSNGSSENTYSFINCYSSTSSGSLQPIIDANSSQNSQINIKNFAGGLIFKNFSNENSIANIDCISGIVKVDETCVSGTVIIAGLCQVEDNSGENCHVIVSNTSNVSASADNEAIATAVWNRPSLTNNASGSMGWLQNKIFSISESTNKIRSITCGRWLIDGSQMIFFDEDNITEIARYNLLDTNGAPFFSEPNAPVERVVV